MKKIKIISLLIILLLNGCATHPSNLNVSIQPNAVIVVPTYQFKGYSNTISFSPVWIFRH